MDSNTNMLKVFENQEFGAVRLTWDSDKILFSATDSAKALGYSNPYSAIKRHCRAPLAKREVVSRNVNQYGTVSEQTVEMSFITEGDLYRLIVHSKLPSAERFERWVFDEVLPAIRKHGAYMTDSVLEQVMENPDTIYSLAAQLLEDKAKCEELSRQLKEAQPNGEKFLTEVKGCTLADDLHLGTGLFPDAPTERGVKHLYELTKAAKEGYHCSIAFVIQMNGIHRVLPNEATQPEFKDALVKAAKAGVQIVCYSCHVEADSIKITGVVGDALRFANM